MAGGEGKGRLYTLEDGLLTTTEAAEVLDVTPATVARWARTGRLPAFRIVRSWRIPTPAARKLARARERDRSAPRRSPPRMASHRRATSQQAVGGVGEAGPGCLGSPARSSGDPC